MILALLGAAAAQEADGERPAWYALPTFDFTTDTGFGFGVAGGLYAHRDGIQPYKSAIELDLYATTKRIQSHQLWLEVLQLADRPLRLQVSAGFAASVSDNFCGIAGEPDCTGGSAGDLDSSEGLVRYSAPTGMLSLLWEPPSWPLGLMGGWYGARYRPGVFQETTPYADSLYAALHPDGETGLYSTAMIGVRRDRRDDEIAPSRGLQADASVRGSHAAIGSRWSGAGLNATAIGYLPLQESLVSATRLVVDRVWGEIPTLELSRFGGWSPGSGLGGDMGRGIRADRYVGRRKAMGQQELRWMPMRPSVLGRPLGLGVVGFLDAGVVADGADSVAAWGTGGGIRIEISDFILRFDMGFSPVEYWQPYGYLDFGHAF